MTNLCGPCAAGQCTGSGRGGICEHACRLPRPVATRVLDRLHGAALADDAARTPYCTGDRCADCEAPAADDVDEECCEATCGYCPRVTEHDLCWLHRGSEDDSKYCSQHGEGRLYPRSPEAERRYQILRGA